MLCSNCGRLFTASCFRLSIARVYFSVCFNPECPSRLARVFIFAPLFRTLTANECLAQCQVICLSTPALLTHFCIILLHPSIVGKSNILLSLSLGVPMSFNAVSFRGITTPLFAECPLVLFCSNVNSLFEKSILANVSSFISQCLNPV